MLLPWLIFLPLIGGILCWLSENLEDKQAPRWVALITSGVTLILTLVLWHQGNYSLVEIKGPSLWQSEVNLPWIPRLGISFHLAADGLSVLMVVLTALLSVIAVLASWKEQHKKLGLFHFNLMLTVAGVMGVFTAVDLFLFFFFWEMMLVPMYFMIAVWGHKEVTYSSRFNGATKFLIYTQASGLVLLVAICSLAAAHFAATKVWSFDYVTLLEFTRSNILSENAKYLMMLGFFIAFAVKMPIIPVHSWLPDAHAQAPTAGSIDITGLLLKTAAYGFLRFSLPFFPEASLHFAPVAMTLGVIGIFYGAWLAFMQTDIKRLIAYTSVSHMGLVMIAIYSGSLLAFQGAVIQMIAHGLSAAGLFIVSGLLYQRLNTRDMRQMGGLWGRIRYLPALSLTFAVATLGMPGTGNFIGEFMMLFGSFNVVPVFSIIAAFGMVFASIYSLAMMQRTYYGSAKSDAPLSNLGVREFSLLLLLVILLVVLGIYPQPVLDTSYSAMEWVTNTVSASTTNIMGH